MSITEASVSRSFLDEVQWVNSTIAGLRDYQAKNWAIGLNGDTGKPDGFLVSFAERGLPFTTYVRGAGLSIGGPDAYQRNIATLQNYIAKERQEEVASVNNIITQIHAYKAQSWAIGLSWPDGQPDAFTAYFAARNLPIAYYVRGNVSFGEPSAYDKNIATLNDYVLRLGAASAAA